MRKIKYVTVVAIVAISGVIGFMSMKKNSPKTELSGLALANVEALTQQESNNSGSGKYFYEHLLGRPKTCVLYAMYNGSLMIGYSETQGSASGGIVYAKVTGTQEICPLSGSGCTVYSCHVANSN